MKQQILFAVKLFTLAGGYLFTRAHTRTIKYRIREKSIPDVAVLFLLENLKRLVVQHARLIRDAEFQVEMLENDVHLLKAFLKDSSGKRFKDDALNNFVAQIKSVVCEAEHVIGVYTTQIRRNREKNFFLKVFGGPMRLIAVAKEVLSVRTKVKSIFGRSRTVFATKPVVVLPEEVAEEEKKVLLLSQDDIEALEKESKPVSIDVPKKADDLGVITIIHMPDLRKTNLGGISIQEWSNNNPLAIGFLFANHKS